MNNPLPVNAARWQQVKSILDQALDVPSDQREDVVSDLCGADSVLRHEVKDFLAFTSCAEDLLPENGFSKLLPWDALDPQTGDPQTGDLNKHDRRLNARPNEDQPPFDLPARAGPYRLIREIGRGGMGVVCLAKRDDGQYERLVALKLIGSGPHAAKFAKLFWRERQILAQLDHPHIARLLDGGTTEAGQPYYAMEFVQGEPLDNYCQRHRLSLREKLELFLSICLAVSYAHRSLIIHRDLKPGNVLVTEQGVPKLLDFGVAGMLAAEAQPEITTKVPLTPLYASPEQIRGEPLTVATDIYSLGVLLYGVLSNRHPYGKREGTAAAFQATLSENPIPLRQQTSGIPADLENIVMVALRKEHERRYVTVDAFAADIRNFLGGFPVQAAPDTFLYRYGKFTKRNRWAVIAATAALLGITVSGVIIWSEKQQAEMRFQQVRQLAHSVVFELHDAIEDLPGSSRARELLITRGLGYLDALAKSRGHDPALTLELARAYMKIGAAQGDLQQANVGDDEGASVSYSKARALLLDLRRRNPADRDVERSLALVDNDIAVLAPRVGIPDALAIENEAVSLFEDMARTSSGDGALRDLALAHFYLAFADTEQQRFHQALPLWNQALTEYTRIDKMDNSSPESQRNLALTEKRMAGVYYALGDYANFTAHDRQAIKLDEGRVASEPQSPTARMDLSFDLVQLGWCLHELRDDRQATENLNRAILLRRQLATADPHDFRAQSELEAVLRIAGVVRSQAGSLTEALSLEQQAAGLGASLHARDPRNREETVNYALDSFELGDVYRAIASKDRKEDRANWHSALSNFQHSQMLVASAPAMALDDPNNREKFTRLPDRIAECLRNIQN